MFKAKTYQHAVPFDKGDAKEAFNVARTALLSLGFEVLVDSPDEMSAEGPGMHSNQQPELLGATSIRFMLSGPNITVEAVLGGVQTMKNFVNLFPPGLIISLLIVQYLFGPGDAKDLLHVFWVLPWIVIGPFLGRSLESKTERAIDRLLRGMAQAGKK